MWFQRGPSFVGAMARRSFIFRRTFSTTRLKPEDKDPLPTPPDSPLYVRLPLPPQIEQRKRERVRGFLPTPREVFSRKDKRQKLSTEYLKKTIPDKTSPPGTNSKARRWKEKVAAKRKRGLRQGLGELWIRHSTGVKAHAARSTAKFEENHRLAVAPEREDDRLTRGTTLESLLDTKVYPDPERFSRADRSRNKVRAVHSKKREARRDALMELYISAANFITNEGELRQEIDKIFTEEYFKIQSQAAGRWGTENAWGIYGQPPSIKNMVDATAGSSNKLMDVHESEYDRSVKRQKRIAEEFTGGKME